MYEAIGNKQQSRIFTTSRSFEWYSVIIPRSPCQDLCSCSFSQKSPAVNIFSSYACACTIRRARATQIDQIFRGVLKSFLVYYKCSKMRCTGKMAPPDENLVNAHSQHRQIFHLDPVHLSFEQ